jgi:hypothetical protein
MRFHDHFDAVVICRCTDCLEPLAGFGQSQSIGNQPFHRYLFALISLKATVQSSGLPA